MAFPATYNIQYYKGDTYQFVIKPKDSTGNPFVMPASEYTANFYIATSRGDAPTQSLSGSASITHTTYSVTHKAASSTTDKATLTTASPHNFVVGESVSVSGVGAPYDGTKVITDVPTATTFRFALLDVDLVTTAVSPAGSVVSLNASATDALTCTITPTQGNLLDPTKTYVYDVSITKDAGATVYTLLTGNITITDDVAGS